VVGLAAPVGRAAGIEDGKAVGRPLVQRDVRVAEDDGGAAGEGPAHPLEPALRGSRVVDHPECAARRLDHAPLGQPRLQRRLVDVAADGQDGRAQRRERVEDLRGGDVAGVQDEVGAAQEGDRSLGQPPRAPRQVRVRDQSDPGQRRSVMRCSSSQ
jgi:hypothetical protein